MGFSKLCQELHYNGYMERAELIEKQIKLSPCKSPKRFIQTGLIYPSDAELELIDDTIKTKDRCQMTYSLIKSYGLLNRLHIHRVDLCPANAMSLAHSPEYLLALQKSKDDKFDEEFGLAYDCPPRNDLLARASLIAGTSLTAARLLTEKKRKIVLNWCGGWHHAFEKKATGFCYINDIVIAIKTLQTFSKKIMYIDLDLHHGDAVEEAFKNSEVLTISVHHYAVGFFPGTGGPNDAEKSTFAVNIPLPEQIGDDDWVSLTKYSIKKAFSIYNPDYVVCQAGGDALFNDPHKSLRITQQGYLDIIQYLISTSCPLLILGGGGYNVPATAKLWTRITALCSFMKIPDELPDEDEYYLEYFPDTSLKESTTSDTAKKVPPAAYADITKHIDEVFENISTFYKRKSPLKRLEKPAFRAKRRKLCFDKE